MNALMPLSQDDWHATRAKHVGASEVAALFNLSPWLSRWTLWQMKAGGLANPVEDSERLDWGTWLEPVIAKRLAERQGWVARNVHRYIAHKSIPGMGCSLDFEILMHRDGPGCFEIKNVSGFSFHDPDHWELSIDKSEILQAPMHYELQLQHQLSCTGRAWGALGVLVDGCKGYVLIRQRNDSVIRKLETEVQAFWASIKAGEEPPINSPLDLKAVTQLFGQGRAIGKLPVDLSEDLAFQSQCQDYCQLQESSKEIKKRQDELKAKLIYTLNQHESELAVTQGFKASFKEQERKEHVVKASKFRVLRISPIESKE